MNFEFKPGGVDESKPLLYMWQVNDDDGLIVYRYVGKAQGGSARRRKHYRRNVNNYIAGKPYRNEARRMEMRAQVVDMGCPD